MNSNQVFNHNRLIQLRGSIDIFVSRSTDNPHLVAQQIQDKSNNCEKLYQNMTPPQSIHLLSNPQNIPGEPFKNDYAYLIIYAKENDLIDDL
jgi:hypothetical protein